MKIVLGIDDKVFIDCMLFKTLAEAKKYMNKKPGRFIIFSNKNKYCVTI